jgi:hypothetical protein
VFDEAARRVKKAALTELARRTIRAPHQLKKLHAATSYLLAYPDDEEIFRLAGDLFDAFGTRTAALPAAGRDALENSGIAGTAVRLDFSYDVAAWLAACPDVDIDWDRYDAAEDLDPLLVPCLSRSEVQTFDDGEVSTRDWVRQAKGPLNMTDLAWIWRQLERHVPERSVREALYEKAGVPLVWRLGRTRAGPPIARLPVQAPFVHRRGLLRFPGNARREITRPLRGIRTVNRARGLALIRTVVAALAARHREVYADCRGNPEEVYEVDLGRGAALILIGVAPEHRLLLEGNYGYLLVKNGMPVGYGGVSPLFHQANTGINVFEEYRRGEAAYLFVQTLRVFHALFGSTRFILNPYQAGGGNTEAVASGAFWFYYKLGFRPAEPEVRTLARQERTRLAGGKAARTSPAVLRRLGETDLELRLPGSRPEQDFPEAFLGACAGGATDRIAAQACPDRSRGAARVTARVARDLGVTGTGRWPRNERRAFAAMAPLVSLADDLAAWKATEKRALVQLMRLKGGVRERPYVRALRRNDRFRRALEAFGRSGGCRSRDS